MSMNPDRTGNAAADFGGIGDISLTFKYRLVEEGPDGPHGQRHFYPNLSQRPLSPPQSRPFGRRRHRRGHLCLYHRV